jgi:hypothetical protein
MFSVFACCGGHARLRAFSIGFEAEEYNEFARLRSFVDSVELEVKPADVPR